MWKHCIFTLLHVSKPNAKQGIITMVTSSNHVQSVAVSTHGKSSFLNNIGSQDRCDCQAV